MKRLAVLLVFLTAGVGWAQETVTERTVVVLEDATATSGEVAVFDASGKRFVLKGEPAVSLAQVEGTLRIGAIEKGEALHATWVGATAMRRLRLKGGRMRIYPGARLKVIGYRDDKTYGRLYRIRSGARFAWLSRDLHSLSFEVASADVERTLVGGTVEAGKLRTREHGLLSVVGPAASVLAKANGRWIDGYGVLFKTSQKLYLLQVSGTTSQQTEVRRSPDGGAGYPLLVQAPVTVTGLGPKDTLQVRYNWPGQGVQTSYVPEKDVALGDTYLTLTGKVLRRPDGIWIETSSICQAIDAGGQRGVLPARLLLPYVGQTVTVTGSLDFQPYARGDLKLRSISAQLRHSMLARRDEFPLPKGTQVSIVQAEVTEDGSLRYTTLQDGKPLTLTEAALEIGQPVAGAAERIRKLP